MYLCALLLLTLTGCLFPPEAPVPASMDSTLILQWKTLKPEPNGFSVDGQIHRGAAFPQPVIDGGKIFVASDSTIQCLNLSTGSVLWTSSMLAPNSTRPWMDLWSENMLLQDGRLILVAGNSVLCVSEADGSKIWGWVAATTRSGGFIGDMFNSYSQSTDAIFLNLNNYPGEIVKLSKTDGAVLWDTKGTMLQNDTYAGVGFACAGRSPTYLDGRVYIGYSYGASQIGGGVYHDGSITCLDAATGAILWNKLIPKLDTTLNGGRYVATDNSSDGNIIPYQHSIIVKTGTCTTRFDSSGNRIWRALSADNGLVSRAPYSPRLFGEKLFVFNQPSDTHLHCLDPQTGVEYWDTQVSEDGSSSHTFMGPYAPSYMNGVMYMMSDDFWMFGVDMGSGSVVAASNLDRQIPSSDEMIWGGFLVQDGIVTVIDDRYTLCWKAPLTR